MFIVVGDTIFGFVLFPIVFVNMFSIAFLLLCNLGEFSVVSQFCVGTVACRVILKSGRCIFNP